MRLSHAFAQLLCRATRPRNDEAVPTPARAGPAPSVHEAPGPQPHVQARLETLPGPALERVCAALGARGSVQLRAVSRTLRAQIDAHPRALLGPAAGAAYADAAQLGAAGDAPLDLLLEAALPDGRRCWRLGMYSGPTLCFGQTISERPRALCHEPPVDALRRQLRAAYPGDAAVGALSLWQAAWDEAGRRDDPRGATALLRCAHAARYRALCVQHAEPGALQEALLRALDRVLLRAHARRALAAAVRAHDGLDDAGARRDLGAFRARLDLRPVDGTLVGVLGVGPRDILGQPGATEQMAPCSFEFTHPVLFGVREDTCFVALSAVGLHEYLSDWQPYHMTFMVSCPRGDVHDASHASWRVRALPSLLGMSNSDWPGQQDLCRLAPPPRGDFTSPLVARVPRDASPAARRASLRSRQAAGVPYDPSALPHARSATQQFLHALLAAQAPGDGPVPERDPAAPMALELRYGLATSAELRVRLMHGTNAHLQAPPTPVGVRRRDEVRARHAWLPPDAVARDN